MEISKRAAKILKIVVKHEIFMLKDRLENCSFDLSEKEYQEIEIEIFDLFSVITAIDRDHENE